MKVTMQLILSLFRRICNSNLDRRRMSANIIKFSLVLYIRNYFNEKNAYLNTQNIPIFLTIFKLNDSFILFQTNSVQKYKTILQKICKLEN